MSAPSSIDGPSRQAQARSQVDADHDFAGASACSLPCASEGLGCQASALEGSLVGRAAVRREYDFDRQLEKRAQALGDLLTRPAPR